MPETKSPFYRALRIVLIYFGVAAGWILVTDVWVGSLDELPSYFTRISVLKGWLFVAVTAAILGWYLFRDYRELERLRLESQKQGSYLQRVLEMVPVGIWLLDAEGRILRGNAEGVRIWGAARYVGIESFDQFKGWRNAGGERIAAREWGAARAILEGVSTDREEIRIEGFDGESRIILHSSVPLHDEQSRISGAIVVNQDISEIKLAQATLRSTKEFLEKILENAPTPIYVVSAAGRIRLVNQAWCELVGMTAEQVINLRLDDIFSAEIAQQYLEHNRQVLATQAVLDSEEYVDLAAGRHYYQSVKFPILDDDEEQLAVAGISVDITELKKLDENLNYYCERLNELSTELILSEERERRKLALGLHDLIGQPLALARIRLGQLSGEESLPNCLEIAREVRALIGETIETVRTLTFELSPPSLYEFGLEAALRSLAERYAGQYQLRFSVEADNGATALPRNLEVLLYHAVRELLVNIVKHAEAHQVNISLGADGPNIRLSVEDDGRGFNPQQVENGFGLFSIRERIRNSGGRLEIECGRQGGTRIILFVPAEINQKKAEVKTLECRNTPGG
jgi:PAS domain S-box-containing protein